MKKAKCDFCGFETAVGADGQCDLCHNTEWRRYPAKHLSYCTNLILSGQQEIKEQIKLTQGQIGQYTDHILDRLEKIEEVLDGAEPFLITMREVEEDPDEKTTT